MGQWNVYCSSEIENNNERQMLDSIVEEKYACQQYIKGEIHLRYVVSPLFRLSVVVLCDL